MFVRSKIVKGHTYYQLVEGYREGSKVRHRTLASLGRESTILDALRVEKSRVAALGLSGSAQLTRLEAILAGKPVAAARRVNTTPPTPLEAKAIRDFCKAARPLLREAKKATNKSEYTISRRAIMDKLDPLERLIDGLQEEDKTRIKDFLEAARPLLAAAKHQTTRSEYTISPQAIYHKLILLERLVKALQEEVKTK